MFDRTFDEMDEENWKTVQGWLADLDTYITELAIKYLYTTGNKRISFSYPTITLEKGSDGYYIYITEYEYGETVGHKIPFSILWDLEGTIEKTLKDREEEMQFQIALEKENKERMAKEREAYERKEYRRLRKKYEV